jgi:amidase
MPDYQGEAFLEHFLTLWSARPAGLRAEILAEGGDPSALLEPVTIGLADQFERRTEGALERAVTFLRGYGPAMDPFFDDADVLLTPVLRTPPVRIGTLAGTLPFEKVLEPMLDYASYTAMWNAAGNPAMSVPLGWSANDLPIGSHFTARVGDEATLLALAYELEDAQPWAGRRPPVAGARATNVVA